MQSFNGFIKKDFSKEIKDLIKLIRGEISQQDLELELELPKNAVNKWENGKQKIKWISFVELCEVKKINLEEILNSTIIVEAESIAPLKVVYHLIGDRSLKDVSKECGISYNTIYNWIKKDVPPLFEHVLSLIDTYSLNKSSYFLDEFDHRLSISSSNKETLRTTDLIYNSPKVILLLNLLELPKFTPLYNSHFQELTQLMSIPLFHLEEMISSLVKTGELEIEGDNYHLRPRHSNLAYDIRKFIHLVNFWFKESVRYLVNKIGQKDDSPEASFLSFSVYNYDDENIKLVKEISVEYSLQLRKLSANSINKKHTRMITLGCYNPIQKTNFTK